MIETIAKKSLIFYRVSVPEDKNHIFTTFLRGAYEDIPYYKQINRKIFYKNYDLVLKNLFSRPTVFIHVASLLDAPDVILGYVVLESIGEENDHILHWAYTKPIWRKIGIHKDLLRTRKIKYITHSTTLYETFRPRKYQFNPFLI